MRSSPSTRSEIEPPTSQMPCVRAKRRIAVTVGPSSGSAASSIRSFGPIAFHFSGSTTSDAPNETARATRRSAVASTSSRGRRAVQLHAGRAHHLAPSVHAGEGSTGGPDGSALLPSLSGAARSRDRHRVSCRRFEGTGRRARDRRRRRDRLGHVVAARRRGRRDRGHGRQPRRGARPRSRGIVERGGTARAYVHDVTQRASWERGRRRRRRRARRPRRARQQRRHHPRPHAAEDDRRRVGLGDRRAPARHVARLPARRPADARARRRGDREPLVRGPLRPVRPGELRVGQGRHRRADADRGDRARPARHPLQRGRTRRRASPRCSRRCPSPCSSAGCSGSRWSGSASRRRSPP